MGDVDLGALARGYRHRPISPAGIARARRDAQAAGLGPGSVAVDVGGGRGDHAAQFAARGAVAVVVDRSEDMARAAVERHGVDAVVGDAESLPLRAGCADLVYFHVSLHYGASSAMLSEAMRVLRSGGAVTVWTFSEEHFDASFLARWFPSVPGIDRARFASPAAVAAWMESHGCCDVEITGEREVVRRSAGSWDEAVAGGFVSTLQMLPPGELSAGLERFRRAHPDPAEVISYVLDYRRIGGRKAE